MTEDAILQFVKNTFRSVWPLELLLVLSQEPARPWSVGALVRELRASVPLVIDGLAVLQAAEFVVGDRDRTWRFLPVSDQQAALARELIDLYKSKPRSVARAIFAAPADRIQTFADAFRLRKDRC